MTGRRTWFRNGGGAHPCLGTECSGTACIRPGIRRARRPEPDGPGLARRCTVGYFPEMEVSEQGKYDELGAVFLALADPTRRRLVEQLRAGDATVTDLAERLQVATPSVSKHLTVLEGAGLVSRHREAQWRRCHLEHAAFARLREWIDQYESLWTGSFDRLEARLRDEQP